MDRSGRRRHTAPNHQVCSLFAMEPLIYQPRTHVHDQSIVMSSLDMLDGNLVRHSHSLHMRRDVSSQSC